MVYMILKILFKLVILINTLLQIMIQSQICIFNYKIYQLTGQ